MKTFPNSRRKFVTMNHSPNCRTSRTIPKLGASLLSFILLFGLLFADTVSAQITTESLKCNNDTIRINFGNVLIGDTVADSINFINNLGSGILSWTLHNNSARLFFLDTSASNIQDSDSWRSVAICNPVTSGLISGQTTVNDTDPSCIPIILLTANGIGPTKNDSTFSLQDTSKNVIAFQSNSDSDTLQLNFQNNSDSTIVISSILIENTNAFSFTSTPKINDSVGPKQSLQIGISFDRTSQGSDNGDLVITMPDHPILQDVALQGIRIGNDAVQTSPLGTIYFYLYPNPSNGPVTIHTENITQAHLTITDVLGRTLTEASFIGDWQWDRSGDNGIAPSGTYFIVVTGIGTNGEPVHQVGRIVLE